MMPIKKIANTTPAGGTLSNEKTEVIKPPAMGEKSKAPAIPKINAISPATSMIKPLKRPLIEPNKMNPPMAISI